MLALLVGLALAAPPGPEATGDAAWARGEVAAALVAWSEALAAARAGGDTAAERALGLRVAAALRGLGRLGSADALLDQLEALPGGPGEVARVQVARGQWQLAAGDPRAAARTLEAAWAAAQQAADPQTALNAAVALGEARLARGDRPGARRAWAAADALAATLEDRVARADAAHRLGLLDRREGDLAAARGALERAVTGYRAAGELAGEADAQAALALVLADLGRAGEARDLLEGALRAARGRRDLARQAALSAALGGLLAEQGDPAAARAHLAAARDAFQEVGQAASAAGAALDLALLDHDADAIRAALHLARDAGDPVREALAEVNLALVLEPTHPDEAARLAQAALERAEALGLAAAQWRALAVLGRVDLARGRARAGIAHLQAAVDRLERTRLALDPTEAAAWARAGAPVYTALVDALLAEGQRFEAFAVAQRLQLAELPPDAAPDADYPALAAEEAFLAAALGAATARGVEGAEEAAALRARLAALRVEFAATVDRLRATTAGFDSLVGIAPEDLEAVQARLDPGTVVLQPVLLPDAVALMVVRRDGLAIHTAPRTPGELEGAAELLLTAMRLPGFVPPDRVEAAAALLGERLLGPIRDQLDGAGVLVICPTGLLRQVPYAMLRLDGQWLVERVAVAAATHVGSLAAPPATAPRARLSGPGLLLVGNPDGSLPGAEAEVRAIAQALPGSTVLIGGAGSEAALAARLPGKQALHLATHGWVDPSRPTRSYLSLAAVDAADPAADGRLSYGEIPGLGPYLDQARLVVLSACESAVPVDAAGRTTAAGEPVISIAGLAAQFRRAGVETLVASLWKVDDEGTRRLMEALYGELAQGHGAARALQRAQLALLADAAWRDPYYWAAFVVVGDPR